MSVALVKIQIRNDTAQAWAAANPVLSDGEPGAESNTGRLKIGNGIDRWLDLPYVGGDGSGGGGVNPITGTIDGGIFTGNPRTSEAGPPIQPAASKVYVDGAEALVVSWGPSYVVDPANVSITYYAVEYTLTPSDETSWVYGGQSNVAGDTVENYALVVAPTPTDPSNEYYYRSKAVLSNGGNGEWGYSPAYRHFKSIEPISFSLAATRTDVGSTGDDNSTVISVENLTGGGPSLQGPEWTYPEVTGINYIEDGETLSLENTNGTDTVNQSLFIQCMYTTPDSASEVQTIQINISDTSVDPGPGPGPGPTPGETLPLFNWERVENSTVEPPPSQKQVFGGTIRSKIPCNGNNCVARYPCQSGSGCEECEVDFVTVQNFTDFTLLWSSPNWSQASIGGIPNPVTQYKKRVIGGSGGACTNDPIMMIDGSELKLPNPMINVWNESSPNEAGGLESTTYYGRYETIDSLSINGSTASYAILYPKQNYQSQLDTSYGLGVTGTVIVTRDGGQTWQFVDILGNGFRYYHPNGEGGSSEPQANAAGMPKAFARSKSITNGREVLVAQFDRVTGENPITQWYYTDDHINWYPTTNADRLTDSTNEIWYDAFTNTTYATDPDNTGVITVEGGTCSYWKSGAGVPPAPPEEPTFNWTQVFGSATEPPGLGNFSQNQSNVGRPPSNWGLDIETGEIVDPYKWPSGYFPPAKYDIIDCSQEDLLDNGTNCEFAEPWLEDNEDGFAGTRYRPKVLCGLQFWIYLRLSVANLYLMYPNGQGNGESVTGDKAICYQSPAGGVDVECQASPIQIRIPSGSFGETELVDFAISNPLYTQIERIGDGDPLDGSNRITLEQIAGAYQVLEDASVGGVTATYVMLTPRLIEWDDEDGNTVTEQFTGCLIVTRDGGLTWNYVDPTGRDVQQINPSEIEGWSSTFQYPPSASSEFSYPEMLAKVWSHMYDREVVVAMYKKMGSTQAGAEVLYVEQFYYTPDNINWFPCDEADGTKWPLLNGSNQQPTKIWTDEATGHTYCVDPTNTGELDQNGTCSYWISEKP